MIKTMLIQFEAKKNMCVSYNPTDPNLNPWPKFFFPQKKKKKKRKIGFTYILHKQHTDNLASHTHQNVETLF